MQDKHDVVVIGGGAVGLCAAFYLHRAGRQVTVLNREPIGVGASAGNAGMIVPSHIVPLSAPGVIAQGLRWLMNPASPFYIKPRLDLDLLRWLWAFRGHCTEAHVNYAIPILRDLSLASCDDFADIQATIGDIGYAQVGLLMLYHSEKGRTSNLRMADQAEAAGLHIERLDADAVRTLEPHTKTPVDGAVLYHQDGRVDSDAFLTQLAAWLEAEGVVIQTGATVERLVSTGSTVTAIQTDTGRLTAEHVVLAAGAWTEPLAKAVGLRVPVQPAKGYSITMPAPTDGPKYPMILTEEKVTITPLPGRLRFAGTLSLSGYDHSVDPRRAAPIQQLARAYGATDEAVADVWRGYRPCSPDGLPIIGFSPRHDNLTVATGHGMMGVTLAPITGKLVAERVQNLAPTLDLDPFRVARF